jgi:hypothetical protein
MTRMKRTCSICQIPLKWWNAQSCMKCGQTICKKHACTIRRRTRSSVLFSLCTDCALSVAKRRVTNPNSQPGTPHAAKNPNSIWSSLSGISFSGISFSGIKKTQPQSNDQPDPIENNQEEQSTPPHSEPVTPIPDSIESSPQEQTPPYSEPVTPIPDSIENSSPEQNDPPPPDKPATPPDEPDQNDEQTD